MDSFEELSVSAELVEALAAEGIERPTPLQQDAIPIVRQGNNLVLAAGPGSGLLVAWATALLDRIETDGTSPRALILTPTAEVADRLAESVSRLGTITGHSIAALGAHWVLPERAQLLFATAADVLAAIARGKVSLDDVEALVVDQAQLIEVLGGLPDVERVLPYLNPEAQKIVSALPVSAAVTDLVQRHFKRSLTLPAPAHHAPPRRGEVRFRITPEPREEGVLSVVHEVLDEGARHVLVFCRSEDRAADVGDFLTLHGFTAGAPGDESVPVWLGVDALEAREAVAGIVGVVVVSCDPPTDPDVLDRRHAISADGVVVVVPRELAHLKSTGKVTGYDTVPFPPAARARDAGAALRERLERALSEEDTVPYLAALEPLFERYDPAEVAAAAVALLRRKGEPLAPAPDARPEPREEIGATPAWAKLFVSVGERDGLRAGDLLGAITGETGVSGDAVGRIDIKESHSLVEVHDSVARKVIRAINGTTIKGRAVRVDFDRPRRGVPRRGRAHP